MSYIPIRRYCTYQPTSESAPVPKIGWSVALPQGRRWSVAGPCFRVVPGKNIAEQQATVYGRALRNKSNASTDALLALNKQYLQCSVVVVNWDFTAGWTSAFITDNNNTNWAFGAYRGSGGNKYVRARVYNTSSSTYSTSADVVLNQTKFQQFCMSYDNGIATIYSDGGEKASVTANGAESVACIRWPIDASSPTGAYAYLVGFLPRVVSDGEGISLAENPWQILRSTVNTVMDLSIPKGTQTVVGYK